MTSYPTDYHHIVDYIIYTYYKLLTKTTAAQNGFALSYSKVRGQYFLAVVFV